MSEVNKSANLSSTSADNSMSSGFSYLFSNNNIVIIILLVLLILALLGINIFASLANLVSNILNALLPALKSILSMIGFTSGEIIKNSADIVADTAELGIDIQFLAIVFNNSSFPSINSR